MVEGDRPTGISAEKNSVTFQVRLIASKPYGRPPRAFSPTNQHL